jgi:hypothetical protein
MSGLRVVSKLRVIGDKHVYHHDHRYYYYYHNTWVMQSSAHVGSSFVQKLSNTLTSSSALPKPTARFLHATT